MGVKAHGLTEGNLPKELLEILFSLASNLGDDVGVNSYKVFPLKGAMTNEVYRISWATKLQEIHRTVLVRVYGEGVELFFSRDEEVRTFKWVSMHGYGPKLLGQFPRGRVEEFIDAKTLSAADLRDPEISALIAAKLREFHKLDVPAPKCALLWDRLRNWHGKAKSLCSVQHAKEFYLDNIEKEISLLEKEFSENQEIGFCHNDLQYGNIMFDEQTRSIIIIDYEYASFNPIAYDLANHFCEMAANYHTDTPHILDYNKYPDLEERQRFVRHYLASSDHQPADAEVERLAVDAEKYTLANHLFWGLWGIISAYVNNIEFDYMDYARQRFQQYWLKKTQILKI